VTEEVPSLDAVWTAGREPRNKQACRRPFRTVKSGLFSLHPRQIMRELTPVFRDFLDLSDLAIGAASSAFNVEGLDLLAHVHLVFAIEKRRIMFALGESQSLKMSDLILRKRANA